MRAARIALMAASCLGVSAATPAGAGGLFGQYYYGGPFWGGGGFYALPAPLTPRVAYPYPAVIGYSPALYYPAAPVFYPEILPYDVPVALTGCAARVKTVTGPGARPPVHRKRCSR